MAFRVFSTGPIDNPATLLLLQTTNLRINLANNSNVEDTVTIRVHELIPGEIPSKIRRILTTITVPANDAAEFPVDFTDNPPFPNIPGQFEVVVSSQNGTTQPAVFAYLLDGTLNLAQITQTVRTGEMAEINAAGEVLEA